MSKGETYNGWANYETWNVALWIGNDEGLYRTALACDNYTGFLELVNRPGRPFETPDGVAWNDSVLDIPALDEMIGEL